MSALFFRISKIARDRVDSPSHALRAARHNLREIAAELGPYGSIDGRKSHENLILRGPSTAAEVEALRLRLLAAAGVRERRNGVQLLEALFSVSPSFNGDLRAYFEICLAWAGEFYGSPILSAVVHLDEKAPHCHALILPLVDGKMAGNRLVGNRATLAAAHKSFAATTQNTIAVSGENRRQKAETLSCVVFPKNRPFSRPENLASLAVKVRTAGQLRKLIFAANDFLADVRGASASRAFWKGSKVEICA